MTALAVAVAGIVTGVYASCDAFARFRRGTIDNDSLVHCLKYWFDVVKNDFSCKGTDFLAILQYPKMVKFQSEGEDY